MGDGESLRERGLTFYIDIHGEIPDVFGGGGGIGVLGMHYTCVVEHNVLSEVYKALISI